MNFRNIDFLSVLLYIDLDEYVKCSDDVWLMTTDGLTGEEFEETLNALVTDTELIEEVA